MKNRFCFLLSAVLLLLTAGCASDSPADQYVELIKEKMTIIEKVNSEDSFASIDPSLHEIDKMIIMLVSDNADYKLTDKDKEKLKEAIKNYWNLLGEKTADYSGYFTKEEKPEVIEGMKLYYEGSARIIESAITFGQLKGM